MMQLIVHDSPEHVAFETAAKIAGLIHDSESRFTFGLAGGSTPEATYRALRGQGVGWKKVDAWLCDERWVPHDHDRSNGLMAATTLLDHVEARFHRPKWSELINPSDAAAHYEATVRSIHGDESPDLVLLGLGTDGHTASLFAGTTALDERERWVVANEVPQIRETRITATYPLLWRARTVMVMVTGGAKAEALRDSLAGETPAGLLGEGHAGVEWHVDRAAASLVS